MPTDPEQQLQDWQMPTPEAIAEMKANGTWKGDPQEAHSPTCPRCKGTGERVVLVPGARSIRVVCNCQPVNAGMVLGAADDQQEALPTEARHAGYLPMDCPACGRRRLEAWIATGTHGDFVCGIQCEKCCRVWGRDIRRERDEADDREYNARWSAALTPDQETTDGD